MLAVADADSDGCDRLAEAVGWVRVSVSVGTTVSDALGEAVGWVRVSVSVGTTVSDALGATLSDAVAVSLDEAVLEADADALSLLDIDALADADSDTVSLVVGLVDVLPLADSVDESETLSDAVSLTETD